MTTNLKNLPYDVKKLPRELTKHYISASDEDISQMLEAIDKKDLDSLFDHIPNEVKFSEPPKVTERIEYSELISHMEELAKKNNLYPSFIGDGLPNFKIPKLSNHVANIRGLTTAYTPYQPERCQGTLMSLWIYSSTMSMLTGFEAVNASMYDRSTCLFEAINSSTKIVRKKNTALVCESIYPQDMKVLETLAQETHIKLIKIPTIAKTGMTDLKKARELVETHKDDLASISFPQINALGNFENVHGLTDLAHESKIQSIAIIDPMLLGTGGVTPPSQFGTSGKGVNMIVGEGQHLALSNNYGGPGLGIFAVRFNSENKTAIRSTSGRYIGKTKDVTGRDALCMVLSTREQHIRREKAGSNICSNQSFIASLAGASILARGEKGMADAVTTARNNCEATTKELTKLDGVELAFPHTAFFNQVVLKVGLDADQLIQKAREQKLHLGVNVSKRTSNNDNNHILLSFSDIHTKEELKLLTSFFKSEFKEGVESEELPMIPPSFMRDGEVQLPNISEGVLKKFYEELGEQNVSPDDNIYPLGSCTMKYNPYINDYAANLPGFANIHPQVPEEDAQGSLEVLYNIQEMFNSMTGLAGTSLQPLAGAQGELAGIKMFQAYHRNNGEGETRDIILIPHSAHGTNPATATMAGFESKVIAGIKHGIVLIEADSSGQIDMAQVGALVKEYNTRICGVMITNPNTSGVFETNFKQLADLIHSVGGLVYMDGANMNAIAGHVDLSKMGVDAVHNNLHKTWSISHGGGGPGDAIVAVSEKLVDYIPGIQVEKRDGLYRTFKPKKSIGELHRHLGNFAHKIRCYAYLKALGDDGIKKMSAVAVLSARYLYERLRKSFKTLPIGAEESPRMHEFILTITPETFDRIIKAGTPRPVAIAQIGKLFLDFGMHAPTVAFPEIFGLMVEPTESFTKAELDRFGEIVESIHTIINENPEVLTSVPHFTPVDKVDEVGANKNLVLSERIEKLPEILKNRISPKKLDAMNVAEIQKKILEAHTK